MPSLGMIEARAWIRRFVPDGSFTNNVVMLIGGTGLGQVVALLASPILTRIYSPEDFGVLSVYVSVLTVLLVVSSLRYDLAIVLPTDDQSAFDLLVLSLGIVVVLAVLMGLGSLVVEPWVVAWTDMPGADRWVWLLPLGFLGGGVVKALSCWAIRLKVFRPIALTKLNQSLGMVATQIGIGLIHGGPLGLLLGDAFGRMCSSVSLWVIAVRSGRRLFTPLRWRNLVAVAARYWRFPVLNSVSGLLNTLGLALPPILLAVFYGPQVAGWFALGQRVFGAPSALIGQSVAQVYFGEASQLRRSDPRALRALYRRTALQLFLLGLPLTILFVAAGPWLMVLVFGEVWRQSGVYLQIWAMTFLADFVVFPLSRTLIVMERQDLQLAWDTGRLVLTAGSLVVASALHFSHSEAVGIYGLAMLLGYLALFVLGYYVQSAETD